MWNSHFPYIIECFIALVSLDSTYSLSTMCMYSIQFLYISRTWLGRSDGCSVSRSSPTSHFSRASAPSWYRGSTVTSWLSQLPHCYREWSLTFMSEGQHPTVCCDTPAQAAAQNAIMHRKYCHLATQGAGWNAIMQRKYSLLPDKRSWVDHHTANRVLWLLTLKSWVGQHGAN